MEERKKVACQGANLGCAVVETGDKAQFREGRAPGRSQTRILEG